MILMFGIDIIIMRGKGTRCLALAIVMLTVSSFAVMPASDVSGSSSGNYEVSSMIRDAGVTSKLLEMDYMETGFNESTVRDTVIDMFSTYFDTNGLSVGTINYSDSARYSAGSYSRLEGTESKETVFLRFSDGSMGFDFNVTGGCRLFPIEGMYTEEVMEVVNDIGPAKEWPASLTIHVNAEYGFERYKSVEYDRGKISDGQYLVESERGVFGHRTDVVLSFELFGKEVVLERHIDDGRDMSAKANLNEKHLSELRDGDPYSMSFELDDLTYSHSETIRYGGRTADARPDGMDKADISKIKAQSPYCINCSYSSASGGLPEQPVTGPFAPGFQDVVDSNTPGITVNKDVSEFKKASAEVSKDIMPADNNKTLIVILIATASVIAICGVLYMLIKKRN